MDFEIKKASNGKTHLSFTSNMADLVCLFLADKGALDDSDEPGNALFDLLSQRRSSLAEDDDPRLAELAEHYTYYREVMIDHGIDPDKVWAIEGLKLKDSEVEFLGSYIPEFLAHLKSTILVSRTRKVLLGSGGEANQVGRKSEQNPVYLGDYMLQVQTHWGSPIVLSSLNLDVCPSIIDTGWWEPWNDHLVRRFLKPGGIYVNLGANFGYFSLLGAYLVSHTGKTYSVEANPFCFLHVVNSALRSGFIQRMKMYNACIHEQTGLEFTLSFNPESCGGGGIADHEPTQGLAAIDDDFIALAASASWRNKLHRSIGEDGLLDLGQNPGVVWYKQTSTNVDRIVEDDELVDLLQIDIEGAEPYAILGAKKTITRSQDIKIILEWAGNSRKSWENYSEKVSEMLDFLFSESFKMYRIVPPFGNPYTTLPDLVEVTREQASDLEFGDVLFSRSPVSI